MTLLLRITRTLGLLAVLLTAAAAVVWWGWGRAAHERACVASCQSNLKQIALAVQMYASDNDGRLPPADHFLELSELVWPYTKNRSVFYCPSGFREGRNIYEYAWNRHLSGKSVASLGSLAKEPMLFDRKPWHGGKRNAVRFQGGPYPTDEPVPIRQLPESVFRRYTAPGYRVSRELEKAFRWGNLRAAERLYCEALKEAGDNPRVAPRVYEELIIVQCKLGKLGPAEITWEKLKRQYPDAGQVDTAKEVLDNAKRGVEPDMSRFRRAAWGMW
ncbi:MAG: hypothetical protein COZ06_24980 [Armatimonadetes bacterium CG_4_10_14_3_um_filter_66_18]|nr:DUF1559 domain-containing protein [Armatimonadota bacterium]OIP07578.1 MAG: hypothetical protein AUJ96_07145 [Armatimonadetes bacterium CG2_30_66_41]PIU93876.1 MAG: hypothetical protein COS65_10425 [Armatimonadetes bacterium CG06_land_8_20_14_3_00_66_21]PIX43150.1 MAG: hypothetical protein COZ57_19685 [Armatimonadetes bacterium CG_4_8_14_3_um_filter_66_20]PIY42595.1 MAG: hypothetical protein COZ06_24980 [Armatimonadetes bacterium CG_4_10_14_3_um_filter_66_18]PJB60595.1 MAG: hypothetical pro